MAPKSERRLTKRNNRLDKKNNNQTPRTNYETLSTLLENFYGTSVFHLLNKQFGKCLTELKTHFQELSSIDGNVFELFYESMYTRIQDITRTDI